MKHRRIQMTAIALSTFLTASAFGQVTAMAAGNTPPTPPSGSEAPGNPPDGAGGPGGMNGQGGPGGAPGGNAGSATYDAAKTLSSDATESGQQYTATASDQIALLVTGATVTEKNLTVNKSGDSDGGDNTNFYGQNAAVLAKDGAVLTISGGTITSDAEGANGIFSYGGNGGQNGASGDGTTVNVQDVTITTTGNSSGGIMTTGGGIMNARNLTITTSGRSSAAIRTDRGGGTVDVTGGTYSTSGAGSPAIYCTADITVQNADLYSKTSEGVVIEGLNSVTLTNTDLTVNNTTTNGNATHHDAVMIYQSMSGDAADGTGRFTMTGGSITNSTGEVFHVTNTSAVITLSGVTITNNGNGVLLDVSNDGWSGAANQATLTTTNQTLSGDILVSNATVNGNSNASSLTFRLGSGSTYTGAINSSVSERGTVDMTIADTASWILTGDSTVSTLSGSGSINYNGYTLTVGSTSYDATHPYSGMSTSTETVEETPTEASTITLQNTKKTFRTEQLAAQKQTYKLLADSNATVSVSRYKGDAGRYIKVKQNGKVIVKKGTPAGKYKAVLRVTSSDGTTLTETIRVVVK
ncbi:MAG: hypothetical protein IJT34_04000 [Butyrivibrio sp.]|nr:hypothetical protein [Butyrivibrio sp.]